MLRSLPGMLFMLLLAAPALGAEPQEFRLVIAEHRFEPAELEIPAGVKVRLVIENRDTTPEEFESYELNREKIVPGKGTITVFVGPLEAGRYPFFGDFHQDTAQGVLVAR
jgi:Cupredoxin-like domain